MRVSVRVAVAGLVVAGLAPLPASAKVHEVSVGNYYYEDDATGNRDGLVVRQGDQIRFTIREPDYPPHSINVDGPYELHSGDLLLFETYTTPPLDEPGAFTLYCRAHRDRGHVTTLTVKAKAPKPQPSEPPDEPDPDGGKKVGGEGDETKASGDEPRVKPAGKKRAAKQDEPVPSGRGVATDKRRAPPDPDSIEAILGRRLVPEGPWTRAVGLAALLALPIGGSAAYALRQEARRHAAKTRAE